MPGSPKPTGSPRTNTPLYSGGVVRSGSLSRERTVPNMFALRSFGYPNAWEGERVTHRERRPATRRKATGATHRDGYLASDAGVLPADISTAHGHSSIFPKLRVCRRLDCLVQPRVLPESWSAAGGKHAV